MRYVQICERCGRVFPREDTVCPKCHFDKNAHAKKVLAARKAAEPTEYKICARCEMPIETKHDKCPLCGSLTFKKNRVKNYWRTPTPPSWNYATNEGTGRGHHGAACDICPHCNGTPGWCPLLD